MTRLSRNKHSKKSGLAPGTLVYTGPAMTVHPARIRVMNFDAHETRECVVDSIDDAYAYAHRAETLTWIDIDGVHDTPLIARLGELAGIHPLVQEDIAHVGQRPKFESHDTFLFFVLRMLTAEEGGANVGSEQVSCIVLPHCVVTFQEEKAGDTFEPLRARLRDPIGRKRTTHSDALAYAIIDSVIDQYFLLLERIGDRIEALEDELMLNPTPAALRQITDMRRNLLFIRRSIWPLRDAISMAQRSVSPLLHPETAPYWHDVHDHTLRIIDALESMREMVGGMHDLYLSAISQRMNNVIMVLTVIGTIFMPLTFLAGVYGMNFEYMPELRWRYGYPMALLTMLVVGVGMWYVIKRRGWLESE